MEERINKLLSSYGVCSRRRADDLLEAGRVSVIRKAHGANADISSLKAERVKKGDKADRNDILFVDGKRIYPEKEDIIIAFNKPEGLVSSAKDKFNRTVVEYIGYEKRIYPVGRLDKESTGLILLTNNGELTSKILKTSLANEKEYIVKVNKPVSNDFLKSMREGVYIKDLKKKTLPCKLEVVKKYGDLEAADTFKITIIQGLNRQIRRMCSELGYRVIQLKRIRIMNIELGDLKKGKYRQLTSKEREQIYRLCGL